MAAEHDVINLREEIDRLIAEGAAEKARARMDELWRRDPGSAAASFVASRIGQLREKLALAKFKLAILRSFTVEPIVPLLRAEAFIYGIDLEVHVGDFNTYVQDIVDASSSLYRFAPTAVVLAVRVEEAAPDLAGDFADLAPAAARQAVERVVRTFEQSVSAFRQHSQAALIVHSLAPPGHPSLGVLDSQSEAGQSGLVRKINAELRRIAESFRGVYILDYDALVARYGSQRWHDERKWLMARLPISADHLLPMAREWVRFLVPLTGRTAKGGVQGSDIDAGERLREQRLARAASTPRLTDDTTVRHRNLARELRCFVAAPHRSVIALQRDQRPAVEHQLHAARWRGRPRPAARRCPRTTIADSRSARACADSSATEMAPNFAS